MKTIWFFAYRLCAMVLVQLTIAVPLVRDLLAESQIVPLSPQAMVHRCYGQLVRKRMPKDHPVLLQVISGQLSAIDACMQILAKGDLIQEGATTSYRLSNPADTESKAVLKTLHNLHRSWIPEAAYPDEIYASIDHHYDPESAAGFFTHALFGPSVPYSSIITDNRDIRILRAEPYRIVNLNGPFEWHDSADIQQGEIQGVSFFPPGSVSWKTKILQGGGGGVEQTSLTMLYSPYLTFQSKRAFGGGFPGLASFVWGHIGYPRMRDKADGAERLPRRWAVHLFSSVLCRDMPYLRAGDVSQMVAEYLQQFPSSANQIPFRANTQCMACHAAQDSLGAALRNVTFRETDVSGERQRHIYLEGGLPTSAAEQAGLHLVPTTSSFHRTPPHFRLFYRSFDGQLIDQSFTASSMEDALTQLGNALSANDDLYMCAAARYFEFFTGLRVNLADYQDPAKGGAITDADLHYRQLVRALALALKNDPGRSVKKLIRSIFELPLYQTEGMRMRKPQE